MIARASCMWRWGCTHRTVSSGRVRRIGGRRCDCRLPGTVKVEQAVSGSRERYSVGERARIGPSHLGGPPVGCAGGGVSGGFG